MLRTLPFRACVALACLLAVGLLPAAAAWPARQEQQKQDKQEKGKKEEEKKDEKKGGGGLFGGFKRLSGSAKSEEKESTVTAGTKGVDKDGAKIAGATPTSTDRSKVASMEAAKPGKDALNAFLREGKLSTERKGGTQ